MLSCRCLRLLACIALMLGAVVAGVIAKGIGVPDELPGGSWFEYPLPEAAQGVRFYTRGNAFLLLRVYLLKDHDLEIQDDPHDAYYIIRERDGDFPVK